jgi:glycerophosphoryl diester phosphodiesterase
MRRTFDDVPVLCGHRGSGAGVVDGRRENTLASFRAAVDAGLRWVEVDVRVYADRVLVASHDPVVDDSRLIAALTSAETDELELMRLADLLEELPTDVALDVDVKTSLEDALRPREETTAALVADLLAAESERRRLLVTSFDPAALLIVRERVPELPLGLLTWLQFPLRKAIPAAAHLGIEVVAPHVGSFALDDAEESIRVAHDADLQVAVWCPAPEQAERFVAAGADCLIVDHALQRARASAGAPVR